MGIPEVVTQSAHYIYKLFQKHNWAQSKSIEEANTLHLLNHHIHTSVPLTPGTAAATLEDLSWGLMTRRLHPEAPL